MIKQKYLPYWKWECYNNGMYNKINKFDELYKEDVCYNFMMNTNIFSNNMQKVIYLWKNTMNHHLTNTNINRIAFVGQCACYYKHQIPEYITRKVWKRLSKLKMIKANNEAYKHIKKWEYTKKLKNILNNGKKDVILTEYQMKLLFK